MNKINELGDKVRLLREERGLSRPVFCGDESELSVRQLVRIEKGEFRPTIKTLEYIADRLEIPSYVLMPDYKELPKRYQELKYFLLHHPDYGDKELQEQKEEYFDEIFEDNSLVSEVIELCDTGEFISLHDFIVEYSLLDGRVFDISKFRFSNDVINSLQTDSEILTATIDLISLLIVVIM